MARKLLFLILAIFVSTVLTHLIAPGKGKALSGSSFRADRIINDGVFFRSADLTSSQIQSFLNARVPICDTNHAESSNPNDPGPPYTCLKSFRQNTPSRTDSLGLCRDMSAQTNRLASQIIRDVSAACGVSTRVLLVLLEKEQSLVTDDWPWPIQYRKATGYGCPDSNLSRSVDANQDGCYDKYAGFFKQVYYAARQYKRYAAFPDDYNYRAYRDNFIQWHPNASCGGSTVHIQNQATAGLYNYTPYRPNSAALNNLYGTGNSCSSYGNRNFWRLYNDWFGSTLANPAPDKTLIGDWNGDGKDTVGIKRGNQYLLDNNNDGRADTSFFYGRPQDTPLVGDWNDNGTDTISIKIGNTYYINNGFDAYSDFKFDYARAEDQPIVGDWDRDGDDTISAKIGNTYYINNGFDAYSDFKFDYGRPQDPALIGDWNGNGSDTVGTRIGNTYYINNRFDAYSDFKFTYARAEDKPIVGDWDNNNTSTIGARLGSNIYYINNGFDAYSDFKFTFID